MLEKAKETFLEILKNKKSKLDNWEGKLFFKMKIIPTSEKGNIGEDFLIKILELCNHTATRPKSRKGEYDVLMDNKIEFEVKIATQDTSNNFQFNEIRYDTKYNYLFCLGVSQENIYYNIIEKRNLVNYKLVYMAKGSNSNFKLTRTIQQLKIFDNFKTDIDNIL